MHAEILKARSQALTMVTATQMRLLSHGDFVIQCGCPTLCRALTAQGIQSPKVFIPRLYINLHFLLIFCAQMLCLSTRRASLRDHRGPQQWMLILLLQPAPCQTRIPYRLVSLLIPIRPLHLEGTSAAKILNYHGQLRSVQRNWCYRHLIWRTSLSNPSQEGCQKT